MAVDIARRFGAELVLLSAFQDSGGTSRRATDSSIEVEWVALAALFVALGGTAFAAATIGTSDIENGAVTNKKLHRSKGQEQLADRH